MAFGQAAGSPAGRKIWEKTWWLFALLFIAANAWAWSRFGVLGLLRFWAAFFAVLGASVLLYASRMRRMADESRHWLPVEATVLRAEVVEDRQTTNWEPGDPLIVYYYPEIEYEYEVEGRVWRSNRLIAVRVNFPKPEAEAWVRRFPPGSRVTARRHPQKPELAVLEPGLAGFEDRYRIPFFVGAGFLVTGLLGWVVLRSAG